MSNWTVTLAIALGLGSSGSLPAKCVVAADPGSSVKTMKPQSEADANLIVSMSMLPKLVHMNYAGVISDKPSCKLESFNTGSEVYQLYGADNEKGKLRVAIPTKKGAPVAIILPITDLMAAIAAAQQNKKPTIAGYLLATITSTEFTGWRFYTGMPDTDTVKHDMIDAAAGSGLFIFKNGADGKTSISVQ